MQWSRFHNPWVFREKLIRASAVDAPFVAWTSNYVSG